MSKDQITRALEKIPYGVSVVTVGRGGVENGLTVSWLCQVAFTPPHLMIAVDSQHYSLEFIESTKNFTVNLLSADQTRLAGHFARPSTTGREKLADLETREAESGAAILTEALAYFDCELVSSQQVGDHHVLIGQVVDADVLHDGAPLTTATGMRYRKSS